MNAEKNNNAQNNTPVSTADKGDRFGLWVGLGAAALTAIGVVGLAIYTDYKESNGAQAAASAVSQVAEQSPSSIPTSETQAASIAAATSNEQSKGMTAPSDVGDENDEAVVIPASAVAEASAPVVASAVVASAPVQIASAASSPAATILAKENALQAESRVIVENGIVRFHFATGKADVAPNTLESLQHIVEGAKAGKKVVVLSYSNVESNERLARERALAVRSVLLAAGVPESNIEVGNPTVETKDSRRVEVILR